MQSKDMELARDCFSKFEGGLIVSCQASRGEPLAKPEHILALCQTVLNGGASALRLEGVENIEVVRKEVSVPIIGITKLEGLSEEERLKRAYITPSFEDARSLASAGADIIALDATGRERVDGLSLKETIGKIHDQLKVAVWADVATYEEGANAQKAGADIVSTTLFGYTKETFCNHGTGPDFDFLKRCVDNLSVPVILEGRVWKEEEAAKALELGAFAVVVGSAITRPHLITRRFVDFMKSQTKKKVEL